MQDNNKTIRGQTAYRQGKWSETLARLYLACKGYKCLGKRMRTPVGEIDLVCRKHKQLIIVEVKAFANIAQMADSPIRHRQARRLTAAAEYLYGRMQRHGDNPFPAGVRIDAVFIDPQSWHITHHRNITQ